MTDTHSIEILPHPPQEVEDAPDVCPGLSLDVWREFREDFDHYQDKDFWQFTAEAGTIYTIRLDDLESRADTVLYLFADCANYPNDYIAMNDDCIPNMPSSGSCITWQAPADSVYHVFVRNYDWHNVFGLDTGYTLMIDQ